MRVTLPSNVRPGNASNTTLRRLPDVDAHRIAVSEARAHHPAGVGGAKHEHRLAWLHEFAGFGETFENHAVRRRLDAAKLALKRTASRFARATL